MFDVEILTRSNCGKRAFLPRIKLKSNASSGHPLCLVENSFSLD